MKIGMTELPIKGAYLLSAFNAGDERGFISKYYEPELGEKLKFKPVEVLTSTNNRNAIRGLHYQWPNPQHKIVWCIAGEVREALLDMRKSSPTFGKTHALPLSAVRKEGVFVPEGVAHGFVSLTDGTVILYVLGGKQVVASERGVRFDDPALGIDWSVDMKKAIVSQKDRLHPLFEDAIKAK